MVQFGKLARLWGVTYYSLSPYQLKPFKGLLVPGFQNTCRRIFESSPPILFALAVGITCFELINNEHHRLSRKNPDDFKDDV